MSLRASLFCAGLLVLSLGANAGLFGLGGTSWSEEALLHDGSKMIVKRSVERGGRHEIGQKSAYKEQSLAFTLPSTDQRVTWKDHFSEDIGTANFLPMLIDISGGMTYLVVSPMGCLSYNKWGRPNPPYVVFKYQDKEWKRIALQELPAEIKTPNLIFSAPDIEVEKIGKSSIHAEMIQKIINGYPQPEYKNILREPLAKERINQMCEERVLYRGEWILPNDPIARKFIDQQQR
jgi:hypothetical protein